MNIRDITNIGDIMNIGDIIELIHIISIMDTKNGDDIIGVIYRIIYKNRKHRPFGYLGPQRFIDIGDNMDKSDSMVITDVMNINDQMENNHYELRIFQMVLEVTKENLYHSVNFPTPC
jgi:hypothetical protein